ncbi:helix-turn-helix domain-containing protein [Streptomyces cinereoruber]|uniref:helix-turn-helix domain-containing protein n=1 Tax=Streptomyces cinereoruber TaxID=67260 RepID=UPI003C30E82E
MSSFPTHTPDSTAVPEPAGPDPSLHFLHELAQDAAKLSDAFLKAVNHTKPDVPPPPEEILSLVMALRELTGDLIGAAVLYGRTHGEPLAAMAAQVGVGPDRLRKKYRAQDVKERLRTRRRPRPNRWASRAGGESRNGQGTREPRQRLAAALTRLHRSSGRSQKQAAKDLGIHASYLSRMLSGERPTSWTYVKKIVDAAGMSAETFKPLMEVAVGGPPSTGGDPGTYLRNYLAALRYACGNPTEDDILTSAKGSLTRLELRTALHGPRVPDWPVIQNLVTALYGVPCPAEPLWQAAYEPHDSGYPAESFG